MICILGESASGKSTVQNVLCDKYGFRRLIKYTTRKPRKGEVDGLDYHFISESEFKRLSEQEFFWVISEYNEWLYAIAFDDCADDKVIISTPSEFRQLEKLEFEEVKVNSFYIKVGRRERLIKILQRGDNIDEGCRRSSSDMGQFDGIQNEVDFIIHNDEYEYTPDEIARQIIGSLAYV